MEDFPFLPKFASHPIANSKRQHAPLNKSYILTPEFLLEDGNFFVTPLSIKHKGTEKREVMLWHERFF
jgi:hypothetical protein